MPAETYKEELTWTVRIEATASFGEDYDGDDDGFVWRERFHKEIQPLLAASVFRTLASLEGWKVRSANRGLPATDELLIRLDREYK